MGGRDEHIVLVLDHARNESWSEALRLDVKLAEHGLYPTPSHNLDRVSVGTCHEEGHRAYGMHQLGAELFLCEYNLRDVDVYCSTEGRGDVGVADRNPLVLGEDTRERGLASGAVMSNICHAGPDGRRRTHHGVAGDAVANLFSLNAIFKLLNRMLTKVASDNMWGELEVDGWGCCPTNN